MRREQVAMEPGQRRAWGLFLGSLFRSGLVWHEKGSISLYKAIKHLYTSHGIDYELQLTHVGEERVPTP